MKNLIIILNTLFLLSGNILFSNIHHLHTHAHSHDYKSNECEECINIQNSDNYILDFYEVNFSINNTNLCASKYFATIEFNVDRKYLSRAPPIFL